MTESDIIIMLKGLRVEETDPPSVVVGQAKMNDATWSVRSGTDVASWVGLPARLNPASTLSKSIVM